MKRLRASKNSCSESKVAALTVTVEGGLPSPVSTITDDSAVEALREQLAKAEARATMATSELELAGKSARAEAEALASKLNLAEKQSQDLAEQLRASEGRTTQVRLQ